MRNLRTWFLGLAIIGAAGGAGFIFNQAGVAEKNDFSVTPETLSASFAEVARRVEPAVVNIDTKTNAEINSNGRQNSPSNRDEDEESSLMEMYRRQMPVRPSYSVGSGFIVDPKGYILTNYHVIEATNKITVRLESGEEFVASVVGTDEETDLAVLKINAGRTLPSVILGDSDAASVGDWVLAIGSPFGLDQTVTAGIISQVKRETPNSGFQKFIQTDAAINRGNSGGPLLNMKGEVVGVNSQIATSTGDYNGIGFALPSNEASYVYKQVLQSGKVRRGYLGVTLDSLKPEFAKVYGLNEVKGAIVIDVRDAKGAAAIAGLQENDVVIKYQGEPISSAQDLISKVASTAPNQIVEMIYLRETNDKLEERAAQVTLGERPPRPNGSVLRPKTESTEPRQNALQLGLTIGDLTAQAASQNKFTGQKGVLVKAVDPNGIIADVKIPGREPAVDKNDLITRVNRAAVTNAREFNQIIDRFKTGDAVILHVARYDAVTKKVRTRIIQFTFQ